MGSSGSNSKSGSGFMTGFGYEKKLLNSAKDFLSREFKYYDSIGGNSRIGANVRSVGYRRES